MDELQRLREEREWLLFALNYVRLPLGIDPTISNFDRVLLLKAFHHALFIQPQTAMERQEVDTKLREIFVNQLNLNSDQVVGSATFDDLGCDSLDMVELLMAIEEEFKDQIGGEIPEEHAEKFKTYGHVLDYIASGGTTIPTSS
jgi:acyl carrier protein